MYTDKMTTINKTTNSTIGHTATTTAQSTGSNTSTTNTINGSDMSVKVTISSQNTSTTGKVVQNLYLLAPTCFRTQTHA